MYSRYRKEENEEIDVKDVCWSLFLHFLPFPLIIATIVLGWQKSLKLDEQFLNKYLKTGNVLDMSNEGTPNLIIDANNDGRYNKDDDFIYYCSDNEKNIIFSLAEEGDKVKYLETNPVLTKEAPKQRDILIIEKPDGKLNKINTPYNVINDDSYATLRLEKTFKRLYLQNQR